MKKIYIFLLMLGMLTGALTRYVPLDYAFNPVKGTQKVVIDAGHGAPDGGAVGVTGVLEKDVNLAIALKIQELLEGQGIQTVLTRDSDNGLHDGTGTIRSMKVTDMKKRLEIINHSDADLFISIHMNSFGNPSANGLHVFYDQKHESIKELAEQMQTAISDATGAPMHDVRPAAATLYLMKNTTIPAILIECGFLSNPEEEKKLTDDDYQSRIAWAIAKTLTEKTQDMP